MEKDLDYYLKLPYTIELIPDSEQGWFVRVKELRGCMSQGDTVQEAYEMIQDAMQGWLEVAIEDNIPIPEPALDEDYSGKFVVRLPRSLHRQLAETAEREGVVFARAYDLRGRNVVSTYIAPDDETKVSETPSNFGGVF